MASLIPLEIPLNSLLSLIIFLLILQDKESYIILKNMTPTFIHMERKAQLFRRPLVIILTNAPPFIVAQSAKGSDMSEGTVATTNAMNVMSGDQDTLLPIVLL